MTRTAYGHIDYETGVERPKAPRKRTVAPTENLDLVTLATEQRAEWVKLEAKAEAIDATVQRANAIIRCLTSEARL